MVAWKLAPNGVVVRRHDLARLPMDRVLIQDRQQDRMVLYWLSLEDAGALRDGLAAKGEKAGVLQLQGRWMKLATVLLWKLARDQTVTLMQYDRDAIPADKVLLAKGHREDIEYRFVPRAEAEAIAKWEKDNENRIILEAM